MDFVVNDKEAVMIAVGELYEFYCRILFVMFLKVGKELLGVAGMDGGRNTFGALGEEGKHTVVHEIVNQDDTAFGATNQVGDISPCVPYAACGKDLLGEHLGRILFDSFKNVFDFVFCVFHPLFGLSLLDLYDI